MDDGGKNSYPVWNYLSQIGVQPSERLAPLHIMATQFRHPWKPLSIEVIWYREVQGDVLARFSRQYISERFKENLQLGPTVPWDARPSHVSSVSSVFEAFRIFSHRRVSIGHVLFYRYIYIYIDASKGWRNTHKRIYSLKWHV